MEPPETSGPDFSFKAKPMLKFLHLILFSALFFTARAQDNISDNQKIKSTEVLAVNDIPFSLSETDAGMLHINFNTPLSKFIANMVNAAGALYYQCEKFSAAGSLIIDIKNLPSGIYFLEIISGKKKSIRKIKI